MFVAFCPVDCWRRWAFGCTWGAWRPIILFSRYSYWWVVLGSSSALRWLVVSAVPDVAQLVLAASRLEFLISCRISHCRFLGVAGFLFRDCHFRWVLRTPEEQPSTSEPPYPRRYRFSRDGLDGVVCSDSTPLGSTLIARARTCLLYFYAGPPMLKVAVLDSDRSGPRRDTQELRTPTRNLRDSCVVYLRWVVSTDSEVRAPGRNLNATLFLNDGDEVFSQRPVAASAGGSNAIGYEAQQGGEICAPRYERDRVSTPPFRLYALVTKPHTCDTEDLGESASPTISRPCVLALLYLLSPRLTLSFYLSR